MVKMCDLSTMTSNEISREQLLQIFLNYCLSGISVRLYNGDIVAITADLIADMKESQLRQSTLLLREISQMRLKDARDMVKLVSGNEWDQERGTDELYNTVLSYIRNSNVDLTDFFRSRGYNWPYMGVDLCSLEVAEIII